MLPAKVGVCCDVVWGRRCLEVCLCVKRGQKFLLARKSIDLNERECWDAEGRAEGDEGVQKY